MIDQTLAGAIRHTLNADPVWGVYALADLQPELAVDSSWQMDTDPNGGAGLALLYKGLTPPILFTAGAPELVANSLAAWDAAGALPECVYLSMREEHEGIVQRWYDNSGDRRPMLRMALTRPGAVQPAPALAAHIVPLQPADAPRILALYANRGPFAPDAFDAHQLESGVFFGMAGSRAGDNPGGPQPLLAAGGTHVVDWQFGIAAIGNIYTHPEHRGQGYAGAILAVIIAALHTRQVGTIILNVDQRNIGAKHLYEKHGFSVHCPYLEGIATHCV